MAHVASSARLLRDKPQIGAPGNPVVFHHTQGLRPGADRAPPHVTNEKQGSLSKN